MQVWRSGLLVLSACLVVVGACPAQQAPPPGAMQPSSGAAGLPPARLSQTGAIAALQDEIAKQVAADAFSGAVLVAKDGIPVFQQAYGYADREKRVANTLQTKFTFGSMAKMFTGVAVAQLAQAGKLNFEDPVSKYLPDYPNKETAAVTIHQLLTHTGGTGDFFGPEFRSHQAELKEHKDYVALFGERAPRFKPGSQWEYSNYGMILVGGIIEVVSGQSYYDYVRDHIFKPAKMKATGNFDEGKVEGLALNYTNVEPGQPPSATRNAPLHVNPDPPNATSAGGGYSTVGDFLSFASALTSKKLLDAEHTQLVTTGKVAMLRPGPGAKYAYGFLDETPPGSPRRIGHTGGSPGQNGALSIYPASGYVIVVLANRDPPARWWAIA